MRNLTLKKMRSAQQALQEYLAGQILSVGVAYDNRWPPLVNHRETVGFASVGLVLLCNVAGVGHGATQIGHSRERFIELQELFISVDQNEIVKTIHETTDSLLVLFLVLSCHQNVSDTGNDQRPFGLLAVGALQQREQLKAEVLPSERKQFGHEHIRLEFTKRLAQQCPANRPGFLQAPREIAQLES